MTSFARARGLGVKVAARPVEPQRALDSVDLVHGSDIVISQAEVQRQLAPGLPVVLDVPGVGVLAEFDRQDSFGRLRLRRIADQKVGAGVAGHLAVDAGTLRAGRSRPRGPCAAAEVDAALERVDAAVPGDAVHELPGLADVEVREQIAVSHRQISRGSHGQVSRFQRRQGARLTCARAGADALQPDRLRIEIRVGAGVLAQNPVAVEADLGLIDQGRAEDVGVAEHRVARRDAAVDGREIVDRNGREVEREEGDAGEQLVLVADVVIAACEQLVDVVELLIDAGKIRADPRKIRQRVHLKITAEIGSIRLSGMMLPGKVPPSGSRNGVVMALKSPRRKSHGYHRGNRGDLLSSRADLRS